MIIYTDASYSPTHKKAVIGYKLNGKIMVKDIMYTRNTEAEFAAIMFALDSDKINNNTDIVVYTDCMRVIDLIAKRNIKKIYHVIFLDKIDTFTNITFNHIAGHKKQSLKDYHDIEFSELDNYIRRHLRFLVRLDSYNHELPPLHNIV